MPLRTSNGASCAPEHVSVFQVPSPDACAATADRSEEAPCLS